MVYYYYYRLMEDYSMAQRGKGPAQGGASKQQSWNLTQAVWALKHYIPLPLMLD